MILLMTLLLFGAALYLYRWLQEDRKRCAGMPPGPLRLPLVGSLLDVRLLSKSPTLTLHRVAKCYGDVMHFRAGACDYVLLSSHEAALEFLNSEHGATKAHTLKFLQSRNGKENIGIIFSNGAVWQVLSRLTVRSLRDNGFGKSDSMGVVINEEMDKFVTHFEQQVDASPERVVLFDDTFLLPVLNVLWRFVSGKSFDLTSDKCRTLVQLSEDYINCSGSLAHLSILAYPWIADWFPKLSGFDSATKSIAKLKRHIMEMVREHEAAGSNMGTPSYLIDIFLQKIDEGKEKEFSYDQLVHILLDLFQGGTDTTHKTISFVLLYLMVFPQAEEKLSQEIANVVETEEPITFAMRKRLPYAHAVILETMRLACVVRCSTPFESSTDYKFRGHLIKANTLMFVNIQSIHLQESLWAPDPSSFRPERFLGEDGLVNSKIAEKIMPFLVGKRFCKGQPLAEATIFVCVVTFLRKFKLEKVGVGGELSVEPKTGLTLGPKPFYAKVVERKK